ncbi:MAG TPA: hypothetical protein DEP48_05650 [Persephonella sp.]|uniref:Uncharacterized protein n=1 Tax=Persephonella marina (strain DSM 14350 / EX-H1) TaxID=123214 RepID=C0QPG3_PERMH|nr:MULTISPECIES: hypothetical protein [Persephonella]ACO03713.1 hypothetical protein PERMA_0772 [Persephonella marina EX-H1]HCB69826.1 hypothetical protein [Persephonella sp.]
MEASTFFLGIIALCMVIITVGMLVVSVVLFAILKTLSQILVRLNVDYKTLSPKVHKIVENLEYTTSILGLLSFFRRKKS